MVWFCVCVGGELESEEEKESVNEGSGDNTLSLTHDLSRKRTKPGMGHLFS